MFKFVVLALLVGMASAACPNACSGNGLCQTNNDFCHCYPGFQGADCSQRTCPSGLSWVDVPLGDLNYDNVLNAGGATDLNPTWARKGTWELHPGFRYTFQDKSSDIAGVSDGEGHFYTECSNAGLCDRSTGICKCFTGFEGTACNRTVCPNDCSGHGTCESLRESILPNDYYHLWETDKMVRCKCDGGYGGPDCSMRLCKKNDDPLTTQGTRMEYNYGLPEYNEVQLAEFSCPFYGTMRSAHVRLQYTDVQFGDSYLTPIVDLAQADADDQLLDALRGLPNNVLSSYMVGNEEVHQVESVSVSSEITDRLYYVTVEFNHRLGDVPLMKAIPEFKCTGGYTFSTWEGNSSYAENILLEVETGRDGPDFSFVVDATVTDLDSGDDTFDYVVRDMDGNVLNNADPVTVTFSGSAVDLSANFDSSLESVSLTFPLGADAGDFNRGTAESKFKVYYYAEGRGSVNNILFNATTTGLTADTRTAADHSVADASNSDDTIITFTAGASAGVDALHSYAKFSLGLYSEPADGAEILRAFVNDEFIGFVTLGTNAIDGAASSPNPTLGDFGVRRHWLEALYLDATWSLAVGDLSADNSVALPPLDFYPESTLYIDGVRAAPSTDDELDLTIAPGYPLPTATFVVVIKLVDVSTSTDTYNWKLAGDASFRGASGGDDLPSSGTPEALADADSYVAAVPDDETRQAIPSIRFELEGGIDRDSRFCEGLGAYYYAQVGSNGVNDAPVCSGRGLCDFTSGLCKCFKGYTGVECTEMNALAGGNFVNPDSA